MPEDDRNNEDNEKFDTDLDSLQKICKIDYYSGTGKGGQHRNRHYTCVRIHHPPSGITVVGTEHRSQYKNKELAFKRLVEKLEDLNWDDPERIPTSIPGYIKKKIKEKKIHKSKKKKMRTRVDESDYEER